MKRKNNLKNKKIKNILIILLILLFLFFLLKKSFKYIENYNNKNKNYSFLIDKEVYFYINENNYNNYENFIKNIKDLKIKITKQDFVNIINSYKNKALNINDNVNINMNNLDLIKVGKKQIDKYLKNTSYNFFSLIILMSFLFIFHNNNYFYIGSIFYLYEKYIEKFKNIENFQEDIMNSIDFFKIYYDKINFQNDDKILVSMKNKEIDGYVFLGQGYLLDFILIPLSNGITIFDLFFKTDDTVQNDNLIYQNYIKFDLKNDLS